ncbi:DUF2079 domain-containing protein [Rothia sp. AR01]|uniref:DUF2079 domain-containing protein n=1 Tax=Rothia santali TaxID=2949643 RepID=A0A9X2HCT2_9MICC|nr:DUF2079 domain-containing protein [Rothia santali]MCP3424744.1 DUF2079 domain-containing protein [Rothia santali]
MPVTAPADSGRSAAAEDASPRPVLGRRPAALIALAVGAAAAAVYLWFSAVQLNRMETPSWDLAIFTQLAKAYASLSAPVVDVKGYGFNLLGDHFHPILVLLGPVYAVWPSPLAVMAVQDLLLGAGAGILAWFGSRWVGPVRGAALGLACALSFGVLEAVRVQFHEVAFAVPLLAASLCLLALRRFRAAALWAAPLVFVKEDLGVTAALIGLLIACTAARGGPGRRWEAGRPGVVPGLLLGLWGVGWTLVAILLVLPALNPGGTFDYGDRVDLGAALADPLRSLALMLYPWQKAQTLGLIVATGAGVLLRSPLVLAALPTVAWRFLSGEPGYWEPTWHYNLVVMPVVFAAVFDAVLRARRSEARGAARRVRGTRGSGAAARAARAWNSLTAAGPLLALAVALVLLPSSPLPGTLAQTGRPLPAGVEAQRRALAQVPAGTLVASDLSLITDLVPEHRVLWIGNDGDPAPDYVVLDVDGSTWGGSGPADPAAYAQRKYGADYALRFREGGMTVLAREG